MIAGRHHAVRDTVYVYANRKYDAYCLFKSLEVPKNEVPVNDMVEYIPKITTLSPNELRKITFKDLTTKLAVPKKSTAVDTSRAKDMYHMHGFSDVMADLIEYLP